MDPLEPVEKDQPKTTIRSQLKAHATTPSCVSCHAKIDPLGLAFENFDAIGRWREKNDQGLAIDSAGKLPDGKEFSTPAELKRLLAKREADLARNLTERLMAYAMGRQLEGYDDVVIDQLMVKIAADNYRVRTIITEVITSYLFTHRRIKG